MMTDLTTINVEDIQKQKSQLQDKQNFVKLLKFFALHHGCIKLLTEIVDNIVN